MGGVGGGDSYGWSQLGVVCDGLGCEFRSIVLVACVPLYRLFCSIVRLALVKERSN